MTASTNSNGELAKGNGAPDPYRILFERSADAILIIEGETFVDCNQAALKMLRYGDKSELLQTHPSQLSPPIQPDGRDSFDKANEMIALAFENGSHRFEWDHVRADGEVFPVEVLLTAVESPGTRILHVVWRDITERRLLESRLRHAQKMEAIGKLAGGIAHDFNNLLVAILGHSKLLGLKLRDRPKLLEHVEQIRSSGNRAAALVRQLLAFSRKQDVLPRILDLNQVIRDLEKLLGALIGDDVELVREYFHGPLPIRADPGHVEQVVVNLATNARDAMPSGGKLVLQVRGSDVTESLIGAGGELIVGRYAVLAVTDTGVGMDRETLGRIFEPFFTTKEVGKGTGLGLATVYGIMNQSGGSVRTVSTLDRGTTIEVYFPIVMESALPSPDSRFELPTDGGSETILVVEDEIAVSGLVVEVLRQAGYEVLLAENGVEALEVWRAHEGQIDLLLTDVVMPRMGGVELFHALQEEDQWPHVIFVSGYSDEELARLREAGQKVDFLEKPFSPEVLVGRVRVALDRIRDRERS